MFIAVKASPGECGFYLQTLGFLIVNHRIRKIGYPGFQMQSRAR